MKIEYSLLTLLSASMVAAAPHPYVVVDSAVANAAENVAVPAAGLEKRQQVSVYGFRKRTLELRDALLAARAAGTALPSAPAPPAGSAPPPPAGTALPPPPPAGNATEPAGKSKGKGKGVAAEAAAPPAAGNATAPALGKGKGKGKAVAGDAAALAPPAAPANATAPDAGQGKGKGKDAAGQAAADQKVCLEGCIATPGSY
jgi:hypothetical protein